MTDPVITLPDVQVEAERDLPIPPIPPNLRPAGTPPASSPSPPPAPQPAGQPEPPEPAPRQERERPSDELTLEVAGRRFTGWTEVRVVRGVELLPAYFVLRVSEGLPNEPRSFPIAPGERCRVLMGKDVVMTGYIDTYTSQVAPSGHTITVSGRSATADLVDCQAGLKPGDETKSTMSITAPKLLILARDLCAPFGIKVSAPDGEGEPLVSLGNGIPQFTIALGQTVHQVLEPLARWQQVLLMDAPDGNLTIAKVGKRAAASGFSMPGNVLSASVSFSKQARFSLYLPVQSTFDASFSATESLALSSGNYFKPEPDEYAFRDQRRLDGKARYRPTVVVSEQFIDGISLAERRAKWQKGRDFGRSQAVTVEVPSWRDAEGALWTPNTLAPLNIPALKLPGLTWLIAQVTYGRGRRGTIATITLMPREAFAPLPDFNTAFSPQVTQALAGSFAKSTRGDPAHGNFNPRANEPQGGV